jgi:hypothetical protein
VEFKGRNPQIVPCCVCKEYVHRTCLAQTLTSTEYVRIKKYKEAFELECCSCFARKHGTTSPSIVISKQLFMKFGNSARRRPRGKIIEINNSFFNSKLK